MAKSVLTLDVSVKVKWYCKPLVFVCYTLKVGVPMWCFDIKIGGK